MWISVHTGIDGPKLRGLRKELRCSKFEATGILIYFWFWGLENAEKDGHILHADREDIEDCIRSSGVGCKNSPEAIVDALIKTGWIDTTPNGFYIHDWEEWQEQWYKAKERRESDAKRKRESRRREAAVQPDQPAPPPVQKPTKQTDDSEADVSEEQQATPQKPEYTEGFISFWNVYPRKIGKAEAYKKYKTRRKDGWSDEQLLTAAQNYALQCKRQHTEPNYIKHPKTFLSDSTPFVDFLPKESEQTQKIEPGANPFGEYGGDDE